MAKKLRFLSIFIILLAVALTVFLPGGKTEAGNKVADGVFLGDRDLSGMTMNEAADAMEEYYEKVSASELTINVRKIPDEALAKMEAGEHVDTDQYDILYNVKIPVATFDFDYSIEDALRYASTLGQTGKLVERYKILMDMKYANAQLPLSYTIDGEKVKDYVENVFAPENTKSPVDAKFSYSTKGLTCTQMEQDGIKVNTGLTVNSILQAFEHGISDHMECTAVVGVTPPAVTHDMVENITFTMVATYTTQFWRGGDESNANRSHNIDMAAKYVNGTLVMPGQRISLNQTIGERTVERGFKIGHAYLNGKVIDVVGGGICQFATTLYQCLLQTELQINARQAHSMEVVYVDYSQDATLDWPYVDLAFTNNWDNPIYITCSTNYNSVTVNFFGVDKRPKNRTIEYKTVIDNVRKTLYPAVVLDSNKAPAYPKSEGGATDAINSHIEKIVRVNGVVQSTTTMNHDYYRPHRIDIIVGCKGLNLEVSRENEIDQIKDGSGNYLLLNNKYEPIYNGRGGYYLAKDYKHDANNVAVYSGGKLVPIGSGSTTEPTQPTQPSTTETPTQPSTEPTQPSTEPTQPSTEAPTEPTQCQHNTWSDWTYSHNDGSSPSSHTRTHTCTNCGHPESETHNCTFSVVDHKDATTTEEGYDKYECTYCHFTYTENIPVIATQPTDPDPTPGEGNEGGEGNP